MLDIQNTLDKTEEIGYLKFFKYMLDYVGHDENKVFFASELIDLMGKYQQDNYPEGIDK